MSLTIKKPRKEYITYVVGSFIFIILASFTLWIIFRSFKSTAGLTVPGLFNWETGVLIFLLLLFFYAFDGLRLLFVFKTIDENVNFILMVKLIFINVFASGVTPLATGGGFAQIYFLSKNKVPVGTATAATTIRTVIATMMIFLFVPIILITEEGVNEVIAIHHGVLYSMLLIIVYVVIFAGLVKQKAFLKKIIFSFLRFLYKIRVIKIDKYKAMKTSVDREISYFAESLLRFWHGRKIYFILSIFSSMVYLLLLFLFPYILIRSMAVHVRLLTALSIQVLITFLIYFTPTPGGSGVAEGGFALVFSHFVTPEYVPPLTFYWRFLTTYLGMVIGFIIFYREIWRKDSGG